MSVTYSFRLISIVLGLGIIGCGRAPTVQYQDPELKVYFDRFTASTGISIPGYLGIRFAESIEGGEDAGYCDPLTWQIFISRVGWDRLSSDSSHEQLVYHELGHCLLRLAHTKVVIGGCPSSIMYPAVFGQAKCYLDHRAAYLNELIHNTNYLE